MSRRLVILVVALHLGLGCQQERELLIDDLSIKAPGPSGSATTVARLQKAEESPAVVRSNFLETTSSGQGDLIRGEIAARILATVNGVPIFEEEVMAASYQYVVALRRLPEPERSKRLKEIVEETLKQLVERELILQDAYARLEKAGPKPLKRLEEGANREFDRQVIRKMKEQAGIKTDAEFNELMRNQGMSLQTLRRLWVRNFMSMEYIRSMVIPLVEAIGREQLLDYYEQHPEEFEVADSVQWQDIFISTSKYPSREAARRFAEELANRVRGGEDFVALCKKHDDGDSALRDGEGIGRKPGEIRPPEIEKIVFQMRQGEVGPVVELASGFHVVRLLKRQYAGRRPFDLDVQKEIRQQLRNQMAARETKRVVDDLRRKAIIQYAPNGK